MTATTHYSWYRDVMSTLYSGCGKTLGLLCAWNRVAAFVSLFLFCAFANFPLCNLTFCCNSGWK